MEQGPRKIAPNTPEGKEHVRRAYELWRNYLLTVCVDKLMSRGYPRNNANDLSNDLVNEVFVTMLSPSSSKQVVDMDVEEHEIKSYLLRALRSVMGHYFTTSRAAKRIPPHLINSMSEILHPHREGRENTMEHKPPSAVSRGINDDVNTLSDQERVRKAIQKLPKELADVINLELEGESIREIALRTVRSEKSVQGQLFKAHRMLRAMLGK